MGKVLNKAMELTWPKGTNKSKYSYHGGRPTKAFKAALKKNFPHRSGWSRPPRLGASCDVAVAVCVRASGVDKKFPRGRSEQRKYKSKHFKRIVKKNARPIDHVKPGDILLYDRVSGGKKGHILVVGNGFILEAANRKKYFHINRSLKKLRKKYPKIIILREK